MRHHGFERDSSTVGASLVSADCNSDPASAHLRIRACCPRVPRYVGIAEIQSSAEHARANQQASVSECQALKFHPSQRGARPSSWLVFILFAPGATIPPPSAWTTWSPSPTTRSRRPCSRLITSAAPTTWSASSWDCLSYLTPRRAKTSIRARRAISAPGASRAS